MSLSGSDLIQLLILDIFIFTHTSLSTEEVLKCVEYFECKQVKNDFFIKTYLADLNVIHQIVLFCQLLTT